MKRTAAFLTLTFLLDWGLLGLYRGLGGAWRQPWSTLVGTAYMFGPAVAAIVVTWKAGGRDIRSTLGISFHVDRWWLVGWLLPPALALGALGVALLIPGVGFDPSMEGLFERLGANLSPEQLERARRAMDSLPVHYFWIALATGLVAGPTVNAVAALGEELGWRGLLQRELGPLGFWRSSAVIGIVWGVWHAPLVLLGLNYPRHPVAGIGLMAVFAVLLSPLLSYVRLRARSTVAAAVMHGAVNGSFGLSVIPLRGGGELVTGMTGAAGFLVLGLANLGLWGGIRWGLLEPVRGAPEDDGRNRSAGEEGPGSSRPDA